MKWCILLNQADLIHEFLGKLCGQIGEEGDEYIIVSNSKIAEYSKLRFFPKGAKVFSRIDWATKNREQNQHESMNVTWKEFFPSFDRKRDIRGFTYEEAREIVEQTYGFLDSVFAKERPHTVLGEMPANIFSQIAYVLCKKYSIQYLGFTGSRISGRIDVHDEEHTCSKYEETYNNMGEISEHGKRIAEDFIEGFLSHKELPSYEQGKKGISARVHLQRYVKREWRLVRYRMQYMKTRKKYVYDYESDVDLRAALKRPFKALGRLMKKWTSRNIFNLPATDDVYYLFPLHLQPEASTSVLATYYVDQLRSVEYAAFSLPYPYKLYVKAHPSAVWENKRNFYHDLKKIPNVVLLSPDQEVKSLIQKSQGVITLTSTIGLEAALAGKNVYILGSVFYSYHPLCRNVSGFAELRSLLQKQKEDNRDTKKDNERNVRFVISYYRNTISGDIRAASREYDTNDYHAIYQETKRLFLSKFDK